MSESPYIHPTLSVEMELAGRKLKIETGRYALQASGSVTVSLGETVVLCAVTMNDSPREGADFFPLTVDYEEKFYAAGKISGSRYVKREGRPSETATLISRLIDRPIRPMFPKGICNDVQVICTVLSADLEVSPATTALIAASAACVIGGLPIEAPVSAVRIGMIDGQFIVNPTYEQSQDGDLDLVVAGTEDAITMVEARANELSDEKMLEALALAHDQIKNICRLQSELATKAQPKMLDFLVAQTDETALELVKSVVSEMDLDAINGKTKKEFKMKLKDLTAKVLESLNAEIEAEKVSKGDVKMATEKLVEKQMRKNVLEKEIRLDGRGLSDVRPVYCSVGVLPRTHGTGLFQRGETQILNICTLAGPGAAQLIDTMDDDSEKRYMHHYNFPGYSVGEVKPMRSPGRREIGHGFLAERALLAVLPAQEKFPYTMRLVSEVLACNGSSSMGSVCGSTLSLMDAGVPITAPVAGIAMGLITNEDGSHYKILSDIQGMEDFAGDMDLKVAGTTKGLTALQMDIKLKGLKMELIKTAVSQARNGLGYILGEMNKAIATPRDHLSPHAPMIESMQIDPEKIREVIGKGGETIQAITAKTSTEIDIQQTGVVSITAPNQEKAEMAKQMILSIVMDPELGTDYVGTVKKLLDFGAIVEFMPGRSGMLHISKIKRERINVITDVLSVGDTVKVRLEEIDRQGRYNLTALPFLSEQ